MNNRDQVANKLINLNSLEEAMHSFKGATPFDHAVVDNFLSKELAEKIEAEFLDYESPKWFHYKNAIEDKKALNDWNIFPKASYELFQYLNSNSFVSKLSDLVGVHLHADSGLHGGGWHIHGTGGNLNPHLDYSLHPKLGLQRKINIIIYVSNALQESHGGSLGLWTHDLATSQPDKLIQEITPKFNRAVVFDTTQNSWHGMSTPLIQPEGIYRKSLAVYYLCEPDKNADPRSKALFAPREEQKNNPAIDELIRQRADLYLSANVYKK